MLPARELRVARRRSLRACAAAARSASSGRPAPASRRCCTCCCATTRRNRARFAGATRRSTELHARRAARVARLGAAGAVPVLGDDCREHRARARRCLARRDRARGAHGRPARRRACASPQGYDTRVGERGVTLSGGQRQRVAIARALLSDAPLLLLDDALSAVDTGTEARILAHLREARPAARAIIVSHRLSAVADADEIIVLQRRARSSSAAITTRCSRATAGTPRSGGISSSKRVSESAGMTRTRQLDDHPDLRRVGAHERRHAFALLWRAARPDRREVVWATLVARRRGPARSGRSHLRQALHRRVPAAARRRRRRDRAADRGLPRHRLARARSSATSSSCGSPACPRARCGGCAKACTATCCACR